MTTTTDRERFLAEREMIRERLQAGGGELTENGKVLGDADLEYDNGSVVLAVAQSYKEENRRLTLTAERPDGGEISAVVDYGDDLDGFLAMLTRLQDEFTEENAEELFEQIYDEFEMLVEVDGRLMPLDQAEKVLDKPVDVAAQFVEVLVKAGWQSERDTPADRPKLGYTRGRLPMSIALEKNKDGEHDAVSVIIKKRLGILIYFESALGQLLSMLTTAQDKLDENNFLEFFEQVARVYPQTFVIDGGEPKLLKPRL